MFSTGSRRSALWQVAAVERDQPTIESAHEEPVAVERGAAVHHAATDLARVLVDRHLWQGTQNASSRRA